MSITINFVLALSGILSISGIALFISKWAAKRNAKIVYGKVVKIVQGYRGATFVIIIDDHGIKNETSYFKRYNFANDRIGTRVGFYKINYFNSILYKPILGYYSFVLGLIFLPWLSLVFIYFMD